MMLTLIKCRISDAQYAHCLYMTYILCWHYACLSNHRVNKNDGRMQDGSINVFSMPYSTMLDFCRWQHKCFGFILSTDEGIMNTSTFRMLRRDASPAYQYLQSLMSTPHSTVDNDKYIEIGENNIDRHKYRRYRR